MLRACCSVGTSNGTAGKGSHGSPTAGSELLLSNSWEIVPHRYTHLHSDSSKPLSTLGHDLHAGCSWSCMQIASR